MSAHTPPPPLTGSARTWGTLALSAATFMNVLDTSIANVSLPAIAGLVENLCVIFRHGFETGVASRWQ